MITINENPLHASPKALTYVCVVLLNWNGWRDTIDCLGSLDLLRSNSGLIVHPIVIDNASTDDSLIQIKIRRPEIDLISSGANGGFAFGNNVGVRRARELGADFVWILNNDTLVKPSTLEALLLPMQNSAVGAVGSVLLEAVASGEQELIQEYGGGRVDMFFGRLDVIQSAKQRHRINYLTCASLLVRSSVIDQVGLLDEGFFMYFEDIDWSWRMRHAGFCLEVADRAQVIHRQSSSLGKRSRRQTVLFNESSVRFFLKHAGPSPLVLGVTLRLLKRILCLDFDSCLAVIEGVRSGLVRWRTVRPQ